jgi:hypothetical protein
MAEQARVTRPDSGREPVVYKLFGRDRRIDAFTDTGICTGFLSLPAWHPGWLAINLVVAEHLDLRTDCRGAFVPDAAHWKRNGFPQTSELETTSSPQRSKLRSAPRLSPLVRESGATTRL